MPRLDFSSICLILYMLNGFDCYFIMVCFYGLILALRKYNKILYFMEFNLYLGVSLLCFMFPILQFRFKYISLTTNATLTVGFGNGACTYLICFKGFNLR